MLRMLDQRVVLITGTSRGIGRYLANHFLNKGDFVIGCSRTASTIENDKYMHFTIEITDEANIKLMFSKMRKVYGRLDVLINNAAVNPDIAFSVLASSDAISRTFDTNIIAVMKICREAVKLMVRKKKGRIINISSMAAKLEVPGESVYTATKVALNSYTKVLAKEVNAFGITVNGVAPSVIKTDLSAKIDQKVLRDVLSRNAIPEYGEMEDVANLIDFLVDDRSHAITGQTIYLGGV